MKNKGLIIGVIALLFFYFKGKKIADPVTTGTTENIVSNVETGGKDILTDTNGSTDSIDNILYNESVKMGLLLDDVLISPYLKLFTREFITESSKNGYLFDLYKNNIRILSNVPISPLTKYIAENASFLYTNKDLLDLVRVS